jgi:hypothetical protein
MNFQKIVPKLSKSIKSGGINANYKELLKNKFLEGALNDLDPMDLIKLIFCINEYRKGNHNLDAILNKINVQLYSFSIVYFNSDNPEVGCEDCGGRGEVNCDYCGGNGSESCDSCDGNGEVEVGDNEYETCSTCDGRGDFDCNYCGGSGSENCTSCDGSGEIEYKDGTQFRIETFVGVDLDILGKLQMANNPNLPLDDEFYNQIRDNSLELSFNEITPNDDMLTAKSIDQDFRGAYYVNKVSEILDFDMRKYGKTIEITNLDDLDDKFLKD